MSTLFDLVCKQCKKRLPIIRRGMGGICFDENLASAEKLRDFIGIHYGHGEMVLLDEHKAEIYEPLVLKKIKKGSPPFYETEDEDRWV